MTFHHGVLWMRRADGGYVEIFNHARTAAYLEHPSLTMPSDISIIDVLDFGGCPAYAFEPPCLDQDEGYAQFSGVINNYLQAPDAAALDIVGDITLIADVALNDWTPGADVTLIGKWSTAGQLSYVLDLDAFGTPRFWWTSNGTTVNGPINPGANLGGLSPGARQAVRVDFDVNNGAAGRTAHFFRASTAAGPWTRIGTAQTSATATTIHSGTSTLQLGYSTVLGGPLAGKIYGGVVRNGASFVEVPTGTVVIDIDLDAVQFASQTSFLATTGQTISVLRSGSPSTILNPGVAYWEQLTFSTPAIDDAPWYHPAYPETADGLGFFIEEWTGLDSPHVTRPVTRTGRTGGGGQHGVLSARERVMKLNVLLFARSEQAMQSLFDWLEKTLYSVCASCESESILIRRTCPPVVNTQAALWDGVAELREVALIEGLTWEAPIANAGHCLLRRASFTLAAADPCMYQQGVTTTATTSAAAVATCLTNLDLGAAKIDCRPRCFDLASNCRSVFTFEVDTLQTAGPTVSLNNNSDYPVIPLRVLCYGDPNDVGVGESCSLPLLGEIYTRVLPRWSELVWDVVGRKIWYTDHTTGGFVSGYPYIEANDPPIPRFFALPCGTHHIVVEPATVCLTVDTPNSRYLYQGWEFPWASLHYPTLSLDVSTRTGCP